MKESRNQLLSVLRRGAFACCLPDEQSARNYFMPFLMEFASQGHSWYSSDAQVCCLLRNLLSLWFEEQLCKRFSSAIQHVHLPHSEETVRLSGDSVIDALQNDRFPATVRTVAQVIILCGFRGKLQLQASDEKSIQQDLPEWLGLKIRRGIYADG